MRKRLINEITDNGLEQIQDPGIDRVYCYCVKKLSNQCKIGIAYTETYPFIHPDVYLIERHPLIQNKKIFSPINAKIETSGRIWIDLFSHWSPQCTTKDIVNEVVITLDTIIGFEQNEKDFLIKQMCMKELVDVLFPKDIFINLLFFLRQLKN